MPEVWISTSAADRNSGSGPKPKVRSPLLVAHIRSLIQNNSVGVAQTRMFGGEKELRGKLKGDLAESHLP